MVGWHLWMALDSRVSRGLRKGSMHAHASPSSQPMKLSRWMNTLPPFGFACLKCPRAIQRRIVRDETPAKLAASSTLMRGRRPSRRPEGRVPLVGPCAERFVAMVVEILDVWVVKVRSVGFDRPPCITTIGFKKWPTEKATGAPDTALMSSRVCLSTEAVSEARGAGSTGGAVC